jgi:CheY-like chemotaxis protein
VAERILLVDDERAIVEPLRYALEKEGYDVLEAGEGSEALHLARTRSPDLVLLDIMLPGMSGFEVCRILRKESSVPILMLSARADEPDRIVGLDLGADDYITKPFSLREVLARIRAALRRSQVTAGGGAGHDEILRVGEIAMDVAHHAAAASVRPAPRVSCQPRPCVDPGDPAPAGVGLRLHRRRPDDRRAHPMAQTQAARGWIVYDHRDRPRHRVQAGGIGQSMTAAVDPLACRYTVR